MACAATDAGAEIGSCAYGADGCLHVTGSTACPSSLQTCPAGDTACQCPASACTVGATKCDDGGVSSCALDVAGGCGVFGASVVCTNTDQLCTNDAGSCTCTPNACTVPGTFCVDATDYASCTKNAADSCLDQGASTACTAPQTCQGAAGSAACACPPISATTGVNLGCNQVGTSACDPTTGQVDTCTNVPVGSTNTVCPVWQPPAQGSTGDCATPGLVCSTQGGSPACNCPANTGTTLFVDSASGSDATTQGVWPTGIQSPAQCRFGTLTFALAKAAAGDTVEATGATPMTFTRQNTGNSETFPITVPAKVTLTTSDATPTPANFVIAFDDGTAASAVTLASGATIQGYEITAASGGNTAASALSCNSGPVTVNTVDLEGGGGGVTLTDGLDASGTCAAAATGLTANGFSAHGVSHSSSGSSSFTTASIGSSAAKNGVGVLVSAGAVTFTNGTIQDSSGTGLDVTAGTVNATGLAVTANGQVGVSVGVSGGAGPTVTLTDGSVGGNGLAGGGADGIDILAGTLTVNGTPVTGSGVNGLAISGGNAALGQDANGTGASFDGNGVNTGVSAGISVSGGTLAATGADASGNKGSGLAITGGTAVTFTGGSLGNDAAGVAYGGNGYDGLYVSAPNGTAIAVHGTLVAANGARGVELTGSNAATVVVDNGSNAAGTVITGNGTSTTTTYANVRAAAGTLQMMGTASLPLTVSNAMKGPGLNLLSAVATLTDVDVTANAAAGIDVDDTASSAVTITGGSVSKNRGDGIRVATAPASNAVSPLTIDSVTVSSNTGVGVDFVGTSGIGAFMKNSTVSSNVGTGVVVAQPNSGAANTVKVAFEGNTVSLNDVGAAAGAGGGFAFTGPSSVLQNFYNNAVHGNGGDQILISGNGSWVLNGAAGSCGLANQIYCYSTNALGLRLAATGVGTGVDADYNSWTNHPPTSGKDYGYTGGVLTSGITAANDCGAVTATCP